MNNELIESLDKPQTFMEYQEEQKEIRHINENVDDKFKRRIQILIVKKRKLLEALKDA